MEDYWSLDLTFINLHDGRGWKAEMSTYSRTQGRRSSVVWSLGDTLNVYDLESLSTVFRAAVTANMELQLGLDLGLLE